MKSRRWRTQYERELEKLLWDSGCFALRTPASGARRKRVPALDVAAFDPHTCTVIYFEVKSGKSDPCRQVSEKQRNVAKILKRRGARVLLAWHNEKWRFFDLLTCEEVQFPCSGLKRYIDESKDSEQGEKND